MLQAARTKPPKTYIDKRQATVTEWVALWNILEVCAKETGYKGGLRGIRWRQAASERQLKTTFKEILVTARELRRREFFRIGGGESG